MKRKTDGTPREKENDDLFREPGTTGLENVLVRELTRDDLDAVVRVDTRVTGRSRREYLERKIDEAMRDTGLRMSLAAETEGTFAGFLLARLYYGEFGVPEPFAIVDTIGVDPGLQGRRVGTALLAQLEANLKGFGIETIRTEVEWKQLPMIGFFASHGFRPAPVLCLEKTIE